MRSLNRTFLLSACACLLFLAAAARATEKALQIYFIDTEGGQATLVVGPSGQSLLIDTGWPGFDGRDANRIADAAKAAGVTRIDTLLITHYHRDHVGGVAQLASRMKIGRFMDHGPNMEDTDPARAEYAAYEKVFAQGKHIVLKPGDEIPMKGVKVEVLTAAGEHLKAAMPGAGQANPYCVSEPAAEIDPSENADSVGILITYGKFRFLDLGDLTKKKELELVCPNNLIGTVDLFLATHHAGDTSNPKAAVFALQPKVAVMNAGARKGGDAVVWQIITNSPGLEDMWQLHYVMDGGKDHNASDAYIANMEEMCQGRFIKATALANGTFTLSNSTNNHEETYPKHQMKASAKNP
jgi:competence protein ComEC